jgi:hypothetical protein
MNNQLDFDFTKKEEDFSPAETKVMARLQEVIDDFLKRASAILHNEMSAEVRLAFDGCNGLKLVMYPKPTTAQLTFDTEETDRINAFYQSILYEFFKALDNDLTLKTLKKLKRKVEMQAGRLKGIFSGPAPIKDEIFVATLKNHGFFLNHLYNQTIDIIINDHHFKLSRHWMGMNFSYTNLLIKKPQARKKVKCKVINQVNERHEPWLLECHELNRIKVLMDDQFIDHHLKSNQSYGVNDRLELDLEIETYQTEDGYVDCTTYSAINIQPFKVTPTTQTKQKLPMN